MKFGIVLLSLIGTSQAGSSRYPSVSINLQDGNFGSLEGLTPDVSYSTGTSAFGCDFEAGATAQVKPTLDLLSVPHSMWGKISREVAGWRVGSRVGVNNQNKKPSIDLAASSSDLDASLKISDLNKIEIDKGFDSLGGRISITPRYNLGSSKADVSLCYDSDSTTVSVDASASSQKLTVSQLITSGHRLTPSITSERDVSVAWKKYLDDGNSITTTVNPGDSVSVKWEDGPWVAEFNSALNGFETEGLAVRIHRKVSFV
mmetsp:Transcript_7661/g.8763  ORF Transcript_7661/g.8763 Transcript_7661/m.8763 type:complete len:259 (+) Transcript_7661:91-867(+)